MGFFSKRKISKLIRNGTEQINKKNYWDAIRTFNEAIYSIYTEHEHLEQRIASLPSLERDLIMLARGGEGAQLEIFYAAAYYGLVLAYLGLAEEKDVEENLARLKSWDRKSAERLKEQLQRGEQPPIHYISLHGNERDAWEKWARSELAANKKK
jgi:hypothetical protein